MTEEDEQYFLNATQCYLCEDETEDSNHIQRVVKLEITVI